MRGDETADREDAALSSWRPQQAHRTYQGLFWGIFAAHHSEHSSDSFPSDLQISDVVFKDKAAAPIGRKFLSLFPGLGYAAGYKVLQRVYKFGGQPYVNDYLTNNHKAFFTRTFGDRNGKSVMSATAGSLIGIGEIVLLPLDVLKIKRQTNPEAFRSRGFLRIVGDEGFALYRGWGWTAARNAPGSFALFGGSAFTKEYIFGLKDFNSATWGQNFVASIGGAVASITVAAPLDVVKTRIQNANFEMNQGGVTIMKDMIKNEGPGAFFKGLTPKVGVVMEGSSPSGWVLT